MAEVAKSSGRGSKPGERRGGRQRNTPNKRTAELQAKVEAEGITPLDYLLSVMRDVDAEKPQRIDCAKAAAQYVHPKLSAIDANLNATVVAELAWLPED